MRDPGQNVVEYGLLMATIALVVLIGTMAFGQQIQPWFNNLAGHITTTGT
jgi:Flp pilus assembly pilin Flp